jgi:sulfite reductase (NADPH) flavoprotein alpha-component
MLRDAGSEGHQIPVYLHKNPVFRLPPADVPIVMIGPGTGVAPFRSFVAERAALGAKGRNWLFFGERVFETDFLYQAEWLAWRKQGVLTRLDVAFSRDQPTKLYVQHRLIEQGKDVWAWLAEGACIYVCGDATRMAPDVHAALIEVVCRHGGYSEEGAAEYLVDLQRQRRYQRDVY